MEAKKQYRSDNTRLISKGQKVNPRLGAKLLSDGKERLYLDYYFGYDQNTGKIQRHRETLTGDGMFLWSKPTTQAEREHNRQVMEIATKYRDTKGAQMNKDFDEYKAGKKKQINFFDYFQDYIDNYTKKDIRMMQIALQRFKDFLECKPKYRIYNTSIKPEQITKDMMIDFTEYLQTKSKGEGARSIYQRFKKVISYAMEHDVIVKNPCNGISIKVDDKQLTKDILSEDEEQLLMATHYANESQDIRRAFIFCLYTGMRFCDVKDLTYKNVDFSNRLLKYEQKKTKGHSNNSGVVLPLANSHFSIIGKVPEDGNLDRLIFQLPTYEACLKALKRWVERAGIKKHISWHCARHSFAVYHLNKGANIKTVASMLGHSGLKHTERYTRAVDELKQKAMDMMPEPLL